MGQTAGECASWQIAILYAFLQPRRFHSPDEPVGPTLVLGQPLPHTDAQVTACRGRWLSAVSLSRRSWLAVCFHPHRVDNSDVTVTAPGTGQTQKGTVLKVVTTFSRSPWGSQTCCLLLKFLPRGRQATYTPLLRQKGDVIQPKFTQGTSEFIVFPCRA